MLSQHKTSMLYHVPLFGWEIESLGFLLLIQLLVALLVCEAVLLLSCFSSGLIASALCLICSVATMYFGATISIALIAWGLLLSCSLDVRFTPSTMQRAVCLKLTQPLQLPVFFRNPAPL
ncbi:MAG: hypothetical protein P8011_01470 [Acidihalobacter sp.]|uniref:hypothetical protein n=1 Tax=Acidihalobacter sp. TaxID=1872108 RepID=UPI00307FC49C